jgi:prepilin-type N-terminal cleavage/methylation domain-containing protein
MKKDFTLVELLIVIAIIAILSSMLLPALSKTRGKGKQISCMNNLKQCYVGMFSYSSDNDNYAPSNKNATVHPPYKRWSAHITDYINNPDVFLCPAWNPVKYKSTSYTYGCGEREYIKWHFLDKAESAAWKYGTGNTSTTILLADSICTTTDEQVWVVYDSVASGASGVYNIHIRHSLSANCLSIDGACLSLSKKKLGSSDYQIPYNNHFYKVYP